MDQPVSQGPAPKTAESAPWYIGVSILIVLGGIFIASFITQYGHARKTTLVALERKAVRDANTIRLENEAAYGTSSAASTGPVYRAAPGSKILPLRFTSDIQVMAGDVVESSDGKTKFKIYAIDSGAVRMLVSYGTVVDVFVNLPETASYSTQGPGSGVVARAVSVGEGVATLSFRPWIE